MSKLEYTHLVGEVLTDATSVVLSDAGETFGIKKADDDDEILVVNDGTAMTRVSVGTYEHSFEDIAYDLEYEYSIKVEYPPANFDYVTGEFDGLQLVEDFNALLSRPDADIYFYNRLWSTRWESSSDRDKEKALITASKTILNLPLMAFETIPQDLKDAACELAIALLDGVDPEQEYENLSMVSQGYANIRSTYDRTLRQEHIESGVVSIKAWQLIRPYLDVSKELTISRV
jgi:hypothetical protein